MHYTVNDIPAEVLVLAPERDGEPLDLEPFDGAEVTLLDPAYTPVQTSGFVASVDQDSITLEWPEEAVLTSPGVWRIVPVLVSQNGPRLSLSPVPVVVEQLSGWHSLASARASEWADAPLDDVQLWTVLEAAREQCEEFAPAYSGPVPIRYRQAQLVQARALWQSVKSNGQSQIGGEGFAVTVFPMDWSVKKLLRPLRGRPVVT
ncbi:hypothetical protein ASF48_07000 [Rathayibacter sp. Leaf299]|uniref:hypothetical protein n=1 Tax=Rathayibacter sp. Leaf299 TaxID=1736328 RepID=UPI000701B4D8|nr:hypothetical protein [Rathayibacter sp. Leaf299]KQQ22878.1 hypothetical protein ASF48_07000 [Rathayibacter sp. Leaf299]